MTSPLLLAQVLVVLTLLVSGAMKLRDAQASRDAFISLRLPGWLVHSPAPVALPWVELALALGVLLLPDWLGVAVTAATLVLFCCYAVVIARALRFEEPVTCGCFGKLGLGTVSLVTLVRNVVLVGVAVLAVVGAATGGSVLAQLLDLSLHDAGWLVGALGAMVLGGLVAHRSAAPEAPTLPEADEEGEYLRQRIPFGQLRTPEGRLQTLMGMSVQTAVLLVFANNNCGACVRVLNTLEQFAEENPEVAPYAVFHEALAPALMQRADSSRVPMLFDPEGSVARTFGVGNPAAVLLGADGLLAGGPVDGELEVQEFLHDIADQLTEARPVGPRAGALVDEGSA